MAFLSIIRRWHKREQVPIREISRRLGVSRLITYTPGFPNLWTIYGPNTNGALPVASFHEKTAQYALQCMEALVLGGARAMEVTADAYWRYNRLVDERNLRKVWSDPRAHNYYWTEHGRSATMNPFYTAEMSGFLRKPDLADLAFA
jgi:4-hydroxyacetophenone monooxygenase